MHIICNYSYQTIICMLIACTVVLDILYMLCENWKTGHGFLSMQLKLSLFNSIPATLK